MNAYFCGGKDISLDVDFAIAKKSNDTENTLQEYVLTVEVFFLKKNWNCKNWAAWDAKHCRICTSVQKKYNDT